MRAIHNWRAVLARAYSVHFGIAAALFWVIVALSDVWPLFDGLLPISQGWFAALGLIFSLVSVFGRFVKQPAISGEPNEKD